MMLACVKVLSHVSPCYDGVSLCYGGHVILLACVLIFLCVMV